MHCGAVFFLKLFCLNKIFIKGDGFEIETFLLLKNNCFELIEVYLAEKKA
jgi:hypothetical protein